MNQSRQCRHAHGCPRIGRILSDPRLSLPSFIRTVDADEAIAAARSGHAEVVVLAQVPGAEAGPAGDLERLRSIVAALGGERDSGPFARIRDIRFVPGSTHSVAESLAAHRDHTDGTFDAEPPAYFALQYVQTDPLGGGLNTFKSLRPIVERCSPGHLEALGAVPIRYARRDNSGAVDEFVGPMLSGREDGSWMLRWRDDEHVAPEVADPANPGAGLLREAIAWLRAEIRVAVGLCYMGVEGDIVIVANHRMTHGRTMLSADSPRWVRRAWIA